MLSNLQIKKKGDLQDSVEPHLKRSWMLGQRLSFRDWVGGGGVAYAHINFRKITLAVVCCMK